MKYAILRRSQSGIGLLCLLTTLQAAAHVSSLEQHGHSEGEFYTAIAIGTERIDVLYTVPRTAFSPTSTAGPAALQPKIDRTFQITNDSTPCTLQPGPATTYSAIDAFQYELSFVCGTTPGLIRIEYTAPVTDAWHVTPLEIWLGDEVSFSELGWKSARIVIPVAQLLAANNWQLPRQPVDLSGKAPGLADYFVLGFNHVLTGYDHMAFLLGLLLVVYRLRDLILLVTSFTIAHSITLAASASGLLTFGASYTEAAIAVTIIYNGAENLFSLWGREAREPSITRRWVTTFVFGLIHGFGFSFLLREIGLPDNEFLPALLLFNLGVETAQISAVLIPLFVARHFLLHRSYWHGIAICLSGGITVVGIWWLIERAVL